MKQVIQYSLALFFAFSTKAQISLFTRIDPLKKNTVNIKWFMPGLISKNGIHVYRKETNESNWTKLSTSAVQFKSYQISAGDLSADKELSAYLQMAAGHDQLKDLVFLAALIKSFKSEAFSQYLGLRFDDSTFISNKEYTYRITETSNGIEKELAISQSIKTGNYKAIDPPQNPALTAGNKKISISWKPETDRYWGTDIYRKTNDSGSFVKITKEPIILSKTKNNKGQETFPEVFYVDQKLTAKSTYAYYLVALDFFGAPSLPSAITKLQLNDVEAPACPSAIQLKPQGKKVKLTWSKETKEDDLMGYSIYRTNKNDSDFSKITQKPIAADQLTHTDTVSHFGSYAYKIASVDDSNNETLSNAHMVEVYDNEPPSQPKHLIIKADTGLLKLTWDKNPEADVKGYLIYRCINKNNEGAFVKITPRPLEENQYTEVLPDNIKNKFLYKVVAIDESLNRSTYSETATASLPDVIAPAAPFIKSVGLNDQKHISIEWFKNAEPDLMAYNIYRKNVKDSLSDFIKLNTNLLDRNSFRYIDRNTEPNVLYAYYIKACDSSGNMSKASNHIKYLIKAKEEEAKLMITSFEARYNAKRGRVELKWRLKNEESLKCVVIYKRINNESLFSPLKVIEDLNKYNDADINTTGTREYELRAYAKNGDVSRSEKINLIIN